MSNELMVFGVYLIGFFVLLFFCSFVSFIVEIIFDYKDAKLKYGDAKVGHILKPKDMAWGDL